MRSTYTWVKRSVGGGTGLKGARMSQHFRFGTLLACLGEIGNVFSHACPYESVTNEFDTSFNTGV